MRRQRLLRALCLSFLLFPHHLISQTTITYRPEFDSSLFAHRYHVYPFPSVKRPRVGLVLSGGGARGAAQIGVLKALEENNIPIDFIAATSMGAIVGGLYASGYTTAELESLAVKTDWDDLLSLSDQARRIDLDLDRKLAADWSFLVVRFEGLRPVLPHAVSSGQRLTNFLNEKTLQALYHPNHSFDDLKIPFRAITTDLVSGKRIILDRGSLAEALRATTTVPLLFNPVEKDGMQLIDGGLVTNIPVDVARDAGCDIVIVVNSTSGLRNASDLRAPWQTADQIMGIMMQFSNQQQMKQADFVITPDIGSHLSSDFRGLDSLIEQGYNAGTRMADSISMWFESALQRFDAKDEIIFENAQSELLADQSGCSEPPSRFYQRGKIPSTEIKKNIRTLYESGTLSDVSAIVQTNGSSASINYACKINPTLTQIDFRGNSRLSSEVLRSEFNDILNRSLNHWAFDAAIERVIKKYRDHGFSLARVMDVQLNPQNGVCTIDINEGAIEKIHVRGGARTEDSFVLREFGMSEGDVFNIQQAQAGITNINSTNLFEFVYLEVSYLEKRPVLTIRISELPSQLVRFGIRADDERNLQSMVDIRDENYRGLGTELGLTLAGGGRNVLANLEFKSNRLFSPVFTYSVAGFFTSYDHYLYGDDPTETRANRWRRERRGQYTDIRYGGRLGVGAQLEKLGNATVEFILQNARIKNIQNADHLQERFTLALLRLGTVIDSRNQYPFPTRGVNVKLSYEFASRRFGSDVGYSAFRFLWENYATWGERVTFHPTLTFGFADVTMPLGQQFRLGGRETMFGTREDDRRGRQMLSFNLELRYHVPVQLVFDTYARVRYDLATISEIPEQIKFSLFRHGIGAELALDTPVGQAAFGVGSSFFFQQGLKENSLKRGPVLWYLTLGYDM